MQKENGSSANATRQMTRAEAAKVAEDVMRRLDYFEHLLSQEPGVHDLDTLHEWVSRVHAEFAYWSSQEAWLEALFCRFYAAMLDSGQISDATFKAIKHSSTMTDRYMAGRLPEIYQAWQRCRGLLSCCSKILDDIRTLLVTHRERTKVEALNV